MQNNRIILRQRYAGSYFQSTRLGLQRKLLAVLALFFSRVTPSYHGPDNFLLFNALQLVQHPCVSPLPSPTTHTFSNALFKNYTTLPPKKVPANFEEEVTLSDHCGKGNEDGI